MALPRRGAMMDVDSTVEICLVKRMFCLQKVRVHANVPEIYPH